jgi:CheY-like chemotaxis protein
MARILVVEDDVVSRNMITRRLVRDGHEVITAGDGGGAVRLAKEEQPDLILMDMGLPVLNGWQATHRIKNAAETSAIPVIALTAYTLNEDRLKSIAVGCDEYETKPVVFHRLQAKIRTLLDDAS